VLVIGQAFEGVPWGFFIANSPAYASEVVPIPLRGAVTGTLQMSWSIGQIIVSGATYGYNKRLDQWAWRAPLALQWLFPVSPPSIALHRQELTRLDSALNPPLFRSRISMVACSSRTYRGGSSFY
jgi:MFS family permease